MEAIGVPRRVKAAIAAAALTMIPEVVFSDQPRCPFQALRSELSESRAGRHLLASLAGPGDGDGAVGLALLVGELEVVVESLSGLAIDGTDDELVRAAEVLRDLPRRLQREPTASLMVLIDEWMRRLAVCNSTPLVERFREDHPPRARAEICGWLRRHYAVTFYPACQTINLIAGGCGCTQNPG